MIVGNKIDIGERSIPQKDMHQLQLEQNIECIECSAKSKENVSKVFESMARTIIKNLKTQR